MRNKKAIYCFLKLASLDLKTPLGADLISVGRLFHVASVLATYSPYRSLLIFYY